MQKPINQMMQDGQKPSANGDFTAQGEQYIQTTYEKLPPQDKNSVERAVLDGQKIMFSQQTHKYMQEAIAHEGDLADNLAVAGVKLVILLLHETKGNIPPNIMLPAASILMVKACEYVDKTQGGMTMDIFYDALATMIAGIHKKVQEARAGDQAQPGPGYNAPAPGLIDGAQTPVAAP